MRKINKIFARVKPHITLTNILLFLILLTIIFGFYFSSPQFRHFINNIGSYTAQEQVGLAPEDCTTGSIPADEYNKQLSDLNIKLQQANVKTGGLFTLRNTEVMDLEFAISDLKQKGPISSSHEDVPITKTIDYKYWIPISTSYTEPKPDQPLFGPKTICTCTLPRKNGVCGWK